MNYKEIARKLFIIAFVELVIILGIIIGLVISFVNMAKATEYEAPAETEIEEPAIEETAPEVVEEEPEEVEEVEEVIETAPPAVEEEPKAPLGEEIPLSYELQQAVIDNCEEYGLDPKIILGIMDVESDFRLTVDNGICYGIMQIHKGNQNWVRKNCGVTDIYDPVQNIRAGCWILSEGIKQTDTLEQALVWYNAGRVYADSTYYSRQVLRDAEKWGELIEA